jgi:hypothetical protein
MLPKHVLLVKNKAFEWIIEWDVRIILAVSGL